MKRFSGRARQRGRMPQDTEQTLKNLGERRNRLAQHMQKLDETIRPNNISSAGFLGPYAILLALAASGVKQFEALMLQKTEASIKDATEYKKQVETFIANQKTISELEKKFLVSGQKMLAGIGTNIEASAVGNLQKILGGIGKDGDIDFSSAIGVLGVDESKAFELKKVGLNIQALKSRQAEIGHALGFDDAEIQAMTKTAMDINQSEYSLDGILSELNKFSSAMPSTTQTLKG